MTAIRSAALAGLLWSVVQNWGGRLATFVLFLILARLLTPEQFGTASAAAIVLGLITVVAELGFGDAIVQRRTLEPDDVTLPFAVSVCVSLALAALAVVFADDAERWLAVPGLTPLVQVLAAVAPIVTMGQFQEAQYRRRLDYRQLALRVLVANLIAGPVAFAAALLGAGAWALVVQAALYAVIATAWLWFRPIWRPGRKLRWSSFVELAGFGLSVLVQRLVDFGSTRAVEVIVLGRHGVAAYGLYAVGSRLYQILLQLLQSALGDLALSVLSRIADDLERMRRLYLATIGVSAVFVAPAFVAIAALAPEISAVLFGQKWAGVDAIMRPLLLLGAVQCVQFLNGPFLSARGRPGTVTLLSGGKNAATLAAVVLLPAPGVADVALWFALAQLTLTPLSFATTARELGLGGRALLGVLGPPVLGCAAGYAAVAAARGEIAAHLAGPFWLGMALGVVFVLAYGAVVGVTAGRRALGLLRFIRGGGASRAPDGPG